ncbi:transferrin receptor-like dimerization domain-containing protein [Flavilitoribacter nigricans]|uniref:Folate hydrolase n=1 Tax=Flavilitoribacter nigricans (strain ATCC 23147 / DSM 23189 / NBRC 102662 / NCIMB 1420 / SS-2) TaxID=1122177 RepID=A0A2D0N4D3_FLAN2|nr:transferrin receptor-like dimerization domain-containing protein [Flavilitoribacter nigricans]PHN03412.1 folate hydrolase [Flavilitoribacter nigricans DSM 23189 = NBRC 102662]
MKYTLTTILGLMLTLGVLSAQKSSIMGFSAQAAEQQKALEAKLDSYLNAENLDEWMKYMTARPHHVGSPYDKAVVDYMADKFRSWGYDVEVEKFDVLFPTPKVRLLELTAPEKFTASLTEPPVDGDASSAQTEEALPPYNCFSIDGDVEAELVFVNYGVPADYEELEKRGIDVKGKIVIAKYQGSWRGIKPKVAAEKGAIGCIIYSDPRDDGYFQGDVYPEGPYKNEYGVQRGAVMDLPLFPGDPLTPGYGATDDAERLEIEDSPALTKIPVLPISYHDAQPLLEALGGPVAPGSWRGALPITYHLGPGPAKVRLKLEFNWELRPAYDVIAKMRGSEYPDEWVIRGNHHDAWVHGANDPVSGMVTVMEEARAVAELAKTGWKPKRTIVYCAWGAEEPGLLGSTEWVETHADELKEKAVAYINTDGTGRGFLFAGGSHTLEQFFDQITRDVQDPQKDVTLFERRNALGMVNGAPKMSHYKLSALGSGSDYSPFFQHLGIASFNMGFGGESSGGEYHTMYDSYEHYSRFKDPGFQYGTTLVKVAGRTTLRLADAEVLPFEFNQFTSTLSGYIDEVTKLADNLRSQTEKENMLIREGLYDLAADPEETFVVPEIKEEVPYLNFAPLQNGLHAIEKQAKAYAKVQTSDLPKAKKQSLNQLLKDMERALTRDHGLPRRPWFIHHIYAPGFYTGYGVKTLPGVREAIEQRDFKEAQEQIVILGEVLQGFADQIAAAVGVAGK